MARFHNLTYDQNYDITDPLHGGWITQGIQGCDASSPDWPEGAEAWACFGCKCNTDFNECTCKPVDVAE